MQRVARASVARAGTPETDTALVARLRGGDGDVLTAIMREHTPTLLGIARLIVLDQDLAQDVVQDVFIALWTHRETLALTGTLGGYLARAVRNRGISVVRHERAEQRTSEAHVSLWVPLTPTRQSTSVEAAEVSVAVRRALDELPARCREIFLMHRSAGLGYPAIAEMLGITTETVHTQMYRATRRLVEAVRALE